MFIAFLLLQAAPVPAAPPAVVAKPVKEKKACRKAAETGTRLGAQQVCRTLAEWAAIDNANQREAGALQAGTRRN